MAGLKSPPTSFNVKCLPLPRKLRYWGNFTNKLSNPYSYMSRKTNSGCTLKLYHKTQNKRIL